MLAGAAAKAVNVDSGFWLEPKLKVGAGVEAPKLKAGLLVGAPKPLEANGSAGLFSVLPALKVPGLVSVLLPKENWLAAGLVGAAVKEGVELGPKVNGLVSAGFEPKLKPLLAGFGVSEVLKQRPIKPTFFRVSILGIGKKSVASHPQPKKYNFYYFSPL